MDRDMAISLWRQMVRMREMEMSVATLFRTGKTPFAPHLYVGEEAIAAGVCAHLAAEDYVLSTHRGHGHCLAKGAPMGVILAEICGKKTGCCGGKGGTMHMFFPEVGVLGTNGIVGAGMPMAVGAALSAQMRGAGQVAVTFFSDGAANNGAFHESANLAALWKLPLLFVCENNRYATSVSVERSTSVADIGIRGAGYGMPGVTVDGNHVDEVFRVGQEAVRRAREGEGPTLIECHTYRVRGHFEGDDCEYRTKEEAEQAVRTRDPIDYWEAALRGAWDVTQEQVAQWREEIAGEVREATEFAVSSPHPEPEDAERFAHEAA